MASVYDLKPRFQAFLRPLVDALAALGVTANAVTLFALLISLCAAILISLSAGVRAALLLLPLVLFVRMALNAIDGMLAREHNQRTRLGAILNEICDVLSDIALYIALVPALSAHGVAATPIVFFTIGAVLTEFAGVLSWALGAGRRYEGPMGKSDRAAVIGLLAIVLALFDVPRVFIDGLFVMLVIATALTVWKRLSAALAAERV